MNKKDKKMLNILPIDFHYKKNITKFMKFYDLSLSDSLDYIFDTFFTELNKKVKLNILNKDFKNVKN